MHILFLFSVTLMPFLTLLLAQFYHYRLALLVYGMNILLGGGALYFSWNCAEDLGLVRADLPAGVAAHHHCAGPVCSQRGPVPNQPGAERRVHCCSAIELCGCSANSAAEGE